MKTVKMNLGDKDGKYAIEYERGDKKFKQSFTRVYMNFPADDEALRDWHKTKVFARVVDGFKIQFVGTMAAAASKVTHDTEYVRGAARKKLADGESTESVQTWLREKMLAYKPGMSIVVQEIKVSENRAMEIMAIEDPDERGKQLVAYLASLAGIVIERDVVEEEDVDETDTIAAEAARMATEVDARLAAK